VRWRDKVISPVPENVALYDDAYCIFTQLYPALKETLSWQGENSNEL